MDCANKSDKLRWLAKQSKNGSAAFARLLPGIQGRVEEPRDFYIVGAWLQIHGARGLDPDAITELLEQYGAPLSAEIYADELWPAVFPLTDGGRPLYLAPTRLFEVAGEMQGLSRHVGFLFDSESADRATLISYSALVLAYAALSGVLAPLIENTMTDWGLGKGQKLFPEKAPAPFKTGLTLEQDLSTAFVPDAFYPASPIAGVHTFRDWAIRFPLATTLANLSPRSFGNLTDLKGAVAETWCSTAGRIEQEHHLRRTKPRSLVQEWKRLSRLQARGHLASGAAHSFTRRSVLEGVLEWRYPDRIVQVAAWLIASRCRQTGIHSAAELGDTELILAARLIARAYALANPRLQLDANTEAQLRRQIVSELANLQMPSSIWDDNGSFFGPGGKTALKSDLVRTLLHRFAIAGGDRRSKWARMEVGLGDGERDEMEVKVPGRVFPDHITRAELAAKLDTSAQNLRILERKGRLTFRRLQRKSDGRVFWVVPDDAEYLKEIGLEVHGLLPDLTMRDLAGQLGISERTLRRALKRMGIHGWQEARKSRLALAELYRIYGGHSSE